MPVDPGNLICLGHIDGIPVLVLPGCAKSPKLNGFDWVLQRLFAGLPVDAARRHGHGRRRAAEGDRDPAAAARRGGQYAGAGAAPRRGRQVAALVLAAGRSRRMAPLNKLLVADDQGVPMVARVVDNALASRARPVVVVTGYERRAGGGGARRQGGDLRPCRGLCRGAVGQPEGRARRPAAGDRGGGDLPRRHAAGGRRR